MFFLQQVSFILKKELISDNSLKNKTILILIQSAYDKNTILL